MSKYIKRSQTNINIKLSDIDNQGSMDSGCRLKTVFSNLIPQTSTKHSVKSLYYVIANSPNMIR